MREGPRKSGTDEIAGSFFSRSFPLNSTHPPAARSRSLFYCAVTRYVFRRGASVDEASERASERPRVRSSSTGPPHCRDGGGSFFSNWPPSVIFTPRELGFATAGRGRSLVDPQGVSSATFPSLLYHSSWVTPFSSFNSTQVFRVAPGKENGYLIYQPRVPSERALLTQLKAPA